MLDQVKDPSILHADFQQILLGSPQPGQKGICHFFLFPLQQLELRDRLLLHLEALCGHYVIRPLLAC